MYKILHLFRLGKFANDNIKFMNENFSNNYHEFWIYGSRINAETKLDLHSFKNVKYVRNIIEKLRTKKVYDFDKIIYHGVFEQEIINFFAKERKLLKRLYLYFWGGDKFYIQNNKWNNLKKKYVIRNAHGIINILPEEKGYMQKYYHPKGKFFCAKYYADYGLMKSIKEQKQVEKDYIAIQVGHSATFTNKHIQIFHLLSKFKDESIKVYVPLSYGNKNYAQRVIKEGKKIFGEKLIALTEYLCEDEYDQFLKHMDIGIFAMNRQQAMGNIQTLLYFGKKIYLRDRSVLVHYFRNEKHCDICTINEISKMEYENFISFSDISKKNNGRMIEALLRIEPRIKAWNKIFND